MTCVRTAWLVLGALSVPLENPAAGYFCTNLDLGYPPPRDVVTNRPDQSGADDRTALYGPRTVSVDITAIESASPTSSIDSVAGLFAPFMVPSARPQLHYVLDRPGAPERVLTVRASNFGWPISGAVERDIQLQFIASDPDALDPNVQTVTAWAGSSSGAGRTYPLVYNRAYPSGGSSPTTGQIRTGGDIPIRPLLRIYGPITQPQVEISIPPSVGGTNFWVRFLASFTVGSGQWVDVDTANKTAIMNSDPTQSVVTSLDWQNSTWPVIPPTPANQTGGVQLFGGSTTAVSQVQAIWQDRYLS